MKKLIYLLLALFIVSSCQSSPDVSDDASSKELIQLGQTAFDRGNKKLALQYFDILLQRYGTDLSIYVEAKYETAHIYVKQKRYREAKPILQEIIDIYKDMPPGQLPGAFGKLAEIDFEKIQKK